MTYPTISQYHEIFPNKSLDLEAGLSNVTTTLSFCEFWNDDAINTTAALPTMVQQYSIAIMAQKLSLRIQS